MGYTTQGTHTDVYTDQYGCDSTRTLNLTVNPLPVIDLGNDTTICQDSTLLLTAGAGFATYNWGTGETTETLVATAALHLNRPRDTVLEDLGTYLVAHPAREGIRRLAAETLGLPTSPYRFVDTREDYHAAVAAIGLPCVVKPVMSSSGKGQSTVRSEAEVDQAPQVEGRETISLADFGPAPERDHFAAAG